MKKLASANKKTYQDTSWHNSKEFSLPKKTKTCNGQ